jgi:thioredoxin 1
MVKTITLLSEIPNNGNIVLDCSATWCGPCKRIAPIFDDYSKEFKDILFLKMDVDESEEIVKKYKITAMPTFLFIKNGNVVNRLEGADAKTLKDNLKNL